MTWGIHGGLQELDQGFIAARLATGDVEALALLTGETDGMASDFTVSDGKGSVAVKDTSTPGNVVSNVDGDAWWTNAGTSPKLVTGSDGVLRWSPHNQIIRSQEMDNTSSAWIHTRASVSANATTAPDGTTTADKLVEDTSNNTHMVESAAATSVVGATYTLSIRAKAAERSWLLMFSSVTGSVGVWFNLSNGTIGTQQASVVAAAMTALGDGWHLCSITFVAANASLSPMVLRPATADNSSSYQGDGSSGLYIWGAQYNRGTVPTDYLATTTAARIGLGIDYHSGSYGLLVEPAATNLLLRSQEFNTTWTLVGGNDPAITANNTAAPNGEVTADLATTAGNDAITQGFTSASNGTNTVSFFAKSGSAAWLRVVAFETAASANRVTGWFNINTGATGTASNGGTGSGATVSIQSFANGWYRCILTGAVNNSATALSVQITTTNADNNGTIRDASGTTFYLWGAQVEAGTIATSHIPTFAATVTRAEDNPSKALSALPFSATAGSCYGLARGIPIDFGNAGFQIDDGTGAERIRVRVVSGALNFNVVDGSSDQCSIGNSVTVNDGNYHQWAVAWAANSFAVSTDNSSVATDVTGTLPTVTIFRLGNIAAGGFALNGHIRKIVWVPRRVSDGDLPTWRYVA